LIVAAAMLRSASSQAMPPLLGGWRRWVPRLRSRRWTLALIGCMVLTPLLFILYAPDAGEGGHGYTPTRPTAHLRHGASRHASAEPAVVSRMAGSRAYARSAAEEDDAYWDGTEFERADAAAGDFGGDGRARAVRRATEGDGDGGGGRPRRATPGRIANVDVFDDDDYDDDKAPRRPSRRFDIPPVAAPYMTGFDFVDSRDGEMAIVTRRITVGTFGPEASFLLAAWQGDVRDLTRWQCVFWVDDVGRNGGRNQQAVDAIEARRYERDFHVTFHCPLPPGVQAHLIRRRAELRRRPSAGGGAAAEEALPSVRVRLRGPHPFDWVTLPVPDTVPLTTTELTQAQQPESFHVCLSALHTLWYPQYTAQFLIEALEYYRYHGARSVTLYLRMANLPALVRDPQWAPVFEHYVESGLLHLVDARPLNQSHLFYGGQEIQLNDCFLKLRDRPRLVLLADLDELFWLQRDDVTLQQYLSDFYASSVAPDSATGRFTMAFFHVRQRTLVTDSCEAPVAFMKNFAHEWRPDGTPLTPEKRARFAQLFESKDVQRSLAKYLGTREVLRWPQVILTDPSKEATDRPKYVANTRNILSANIHVPETVAWLKSARLEFPETELVKLHARLLPIERVVCRNIVPHRSVLPRQEPNRDLLFYDLSGPLYAGYMLPRVQEARQAIQDRRRRGGDGKRPAKAASAGAGAGAADDYDADAAR